MLRAVGGGLIFLAIYFVAAQMQFYFAISWTDPAPVWLPAGIGLVALILWGWRGLPLVALAALLAAAPLWLANVGVSARGFLHLFTAAGLETALAALTYTMWRRFTPDGIGDWGATLRFTALVAMIPCVLITPLLVANYSASGAWAGLPPRSLLAYASVLLLGNILGILLVTPSYLAWVEEGWPPLRKLIYAAVGLLLLLVLHVVAFQFDTTYIYLTVPVLLLVSLVSGARMASIASLLLVVSAVAVAVADRGPFTGPDGGVTYLPLLVYLLVLVISSLIGRVQYAHILRQQNDLQATVARRTAELHREVLARTAAAEAALAGERRLREQTAYQALLFSNLSDAVIATDLELYIRTWNRAAEEIYGWKAEEVIDRYLPEVTQLQNAPGSREQLLQLLLVQGVWKGEASQRRRDGSTVAIQTAVALVRDANGRPDGIVAVNRDMTEQRRAWQALEDERAQLAERVAERTAELQQTNDDLQRALSAKDEFLAHMSHELRTPLNTVLMLAELLEMERSGPLTDKQRQHLQTMRNNSRHLLALLNNILDYSKLQANRLEVDCTLVPVMELCNASVSLISAQAERKQISVALSIDPAVGAVRADEQRTRQILVNLLGNAVKFTAEGGRVGLEVTGDPGGQRLLFAVWDTGIGIAAEDFGRLFEPFVQVETGPARHYGGTGLGLPLSMHLAQLQGGGIEVQSEVGKGSWFTLWLPWEK